MTRFRVWGPAAEQIDLALGDQRVPMRRDEGGWWVAEVDGADHGSDYAFVLDGGEPVPDPRSPWQPHGIQGRSRVLDPGRFRWTDERFQAPPLGSGVLYELHVGTFSPEGTFDGAIEHLDHLVELGITHVEIMPVNEFSGSRGWGYDGVNLFAPHHYYGGPEGLMRFVNACHGRGLAVILDVVYNHFGPIGNVLPRFGPYLTDRYETPWGQAVNLDGRASHEVRRFFCDNALMWLRDYHLDGLRIDAVHAFVDTSAIHFLEQLAGEVEALEKHLGRHLVLIAESDLNDPRVVTPTAAGGFGLDAQWNEDFHHALHAALTGERDGYYADFGSLSDLATTLGRVFLYDGRYSRFRDRRHGRPAVGLSGDRFVGFLQNHDQVGNRALGERTSQLLSPERTMIGAAWVFMAPFVPMLFQGEEWGASTPFLYFTDHQDPELAEAVRKGRRREFAAFGWDPEKIPDPQAEETFHRSKLDWSEMGREPHAEILDWHRQLIALRRQQPAVTDGRVERIEAKASDEEAWLVMERGALTVACNLSRERRRVPLEEREGREVLLATHAPVELAPRSVTLEPDALAILGRAL